METVKLVIPKKSEYISAVRLTTSAISNISGFNIDDIEDLKVILSEICTFFINNIKANEKTFEIEYFMEENDLRVEVKDLNEGEIEGNESSDSEMCLLIIESLADNYSIDLESKKICFEKKIIKEL